MNKKAFFLLLIFLLTAVANSGCSPRYGCPGNPEYTKKKGAKKGKVESGNPTPPKK